jgi:hypothetical protein
MSAELDTGAASRASMRAGINTFCHEPCAQA